MIIRMLIVFITISINSVAENDISLNTVPMVDLKKYSGTWYEIAKIPNRFQKNCISDTTATYNLSDNGRISVVNKCLDKKGKLLVAEGIAKIVDTNSNSKLKVSFFSIFGWHLFWGDYWIIGLGDDYDYAIIGHPDRKYGWILNRTPQLSKEKNEEIFKIIENSGYNPDKFEFPKQDYND
ncbi:MAG TPA: lipocalin family protein [Thermodesulfobacteriota bacterium]|nr:lipocalin family protein [Thermodesulfobacteriota bacterium]